MKFWRRKPVVKAGGPTVREELMELTLDNVLVRKIMHIVVSQVPQEREGASYVGGKYSYIEGVVRGYHDFRKEMLYILR